MNEETIWLLPDDAISPLFRARRLWTDGPELQTAISALARAQPRPRPIAERSEVNKQVVTYAVLRARDAVLCLRRVADAGRDLRLRRVLMFGGHLDASEPPTRAGLCRALLRELDEEFGSLKLARAPRLIGVVTDPLTPVGRRHIAFVFEAWLDQVEVWLDPGRDNAEYTGRNDRHALTPLASLLADRRDDFDPWSQALLDFLESEVTPRANADTT